MKKFTEWLENKLLLENSGYNFLNAALVNMRPGPGGYTFTFNFPSMGAQETDRPDVDYETIRRLTWRSGGSGRRSGGYSGSDYSYGYLGSEIGKALFQGMERAEFDIAKLFRRFFEKLPNNKLKGSITLPLQLPTIQGNPIVKDLWASLDGLQYKKDVLNKIIKNIKVIEPYIRMEGEFQESDKKFDMPDKEFGNQSKAKAFTQGLAIMLLWMINTEAESSSGEN